MMLSDMADKIQQPAKEVTSTKDRLDKAEKNFDFLQLLNVSIQLAHTS
jgi:hypothetical protein